MNKEYFEKIDAFFRLLFNYGPASKLKYLKSIAKERGIELPDLYLDFYEAIRRKMPKSLVGTDILKDVDEFNLWAEELLAENGIKSFLTEKDFVFMVHQGYIFWFFKADGTRDPIVFCYSEEDKSKIEIGPFSEFMTQNEI